MRVRVDVVEILAKEIANSRRLAYTGSRNIGPAHCRIVRYVPSLPLAEAKERILLQFFKPWESNAMLYT